MDECKGSVISEYFTYGRAFPCFRDIRSSSGRFIDSLIPPEVQNEIETDRSKCGVGGHVVCSCAPRFAADGAKEATQANKQANDALYHNSYSPITPISRMPIKVLLLHFRSK
jgi:hypothetical protein